MFAFLSGCAVARIQTYDPDYKNTRQLENVKGSFNEVSAVGATELVSLKISKSSLSCRLTTFSTPTNQPISQYISDALLTELDSAKKVSPTGKSIEIKVNNLESDTSGMNTGTWTLDFTYKTNEETKNVKTITEFASAFTADTACRNTADALKTALRENFGRYFEAISKK